MREKKKHHHRVLIQPNVDYIMWDRRVLTYFEIRIGSSTKPEVAHRGLTKGAEKENQSLTWKSRHKSAWQHHHPHSLQLKIK